MPFSFLNINNLFSSGCCQWLPELQGKFDPWLSQYFYIFYLNRLWDLDSQDKYWWDMETRYPLDFQPQHNLSFRVILPGRKVSIHVQQYNWWVYNWCGWYFVKTRPNSCIFMLLTSKCTGRYDWHQYFPNVTVDDSESVAKLLPKSVMDNYAWFYITLHLEVSCYCISASPLLVHNQSASSVSHTVNPQLLSMVISVIQSMARANRSPSHALPFEILYHLHQLQEISMKCLLTDHYSS